MSTKHTTRKAGKAGKQLTQARKQARALKYGGTR